jgi:hypothetical protein
MSGPWPVQRSNDTLQGFEGIRFYSPFAILFADISSEMLYPMLCVIMSSFIAV